MTSSEHQTQEEEKTQSETRNIHLISSGDIRPLCTDAELRNILASQRVAHVTEMHGLGLLRGIVRVRGRVHGEVLVVAEGEDGAL